MQRKPKIAVLSNCTGASISIALRVFEISEDVSSFELFSMSDTDRELLADSLSTYDFIVTALHGAKYGRLAAASLKKEFPSKTITFAVPFFSGLHPEFGYITHNGQHLINKNLLGDYHLGLPLELLKNGFDQAEIFEIISSNRYWSFFNPMKAWSLSIDTLKQRELDADIKFADFIESEALKSQCFYSFNHPSEKIVTQILRDFVRVSEIKSVIRGFPIAMHNLVDGAYLPVSDYVADELDLLYRTPQHIRRPRKVDEDFQILNLELVRKESFEFLLKYINENDARLEDLQVTSPIYFKDYVTL